MRATTKMISRALGLILFWLTLAGAGDVLAQSEAEIAQAREHFSRAIGLYEEEAYEAALADFLRAYELAPHYAFLYNIGLVQDHLHRYGPAASSLESYLREGGDEIPEERRRQVQRELRRIGRLVGHLQLDLSGPQVATVHVDGSQVATLPLERPIPLTAGRRTVEVRAPGYLPYRREVILTGGASVTLGATLTQAPTQSGAIIITLDLPGVTLSLDGEEVGTSPLEGPVIAEPGRHVVEASRPGYQTVGRTVEVAQGEFETLELTMDPLDQLPAEAASQLALQLSEPDAEVLLDGEPLSAEQIPSGPHVLEVRRTGFHSEWRELDVEAGAAAHLEIDLRPTEDYLTTYNGRARRWRLAAWLSLGLGVAIMAADLGLYLWNRGRHYDWVAESALLIKDAQRPPEEQTISEPDALLRYSSAEALGDELAAWSIAHWIALAVGLASTIAGVTLFSIGPSPHRYDRFTVAPLEGGLMVAFGGALR